MSLDPTRICRRLVDNRARKAVYELGKMMLLHDFVQLPAAVLEEEVEEQRCIGSVHFIESAPEYATLLLTYMAAAIVAQLGAGAILSPAEFTLPPHLLLHAGENLATPLETFHWVATFSPFTVASVSKAYKSVSGGGWWDLLAAALEYLKIVMRATKTPDGQTQTCASLDTNSAVRTALGITGSETALGVAHRCHAHVAAAVFSRLESFSQEVRACRRLGFHDCACVMLVVHCVRMCV